MADGEQRDVDSPRGSEFVQSLERGLAVIKAFDGDHPELTLSEVARASGLPRAAARRFLLTLVELGYVRTDKRMFALRPRILELGYTYISSLTLPELALPHMEALVAQVHQSSSISVLDGHEIVYVARVPTKRIMAVRISIGTRFPAHATSMGHVLLANQPEEWLEEYLATAQLERFTSQTVTDPNKLRTVLAQVRSRGYALADQELEEGLRSIAVPIKDSNDEVVGAMNVSASASVCTAETLRKDVLPPLRATVGRIEDDLWGGQALGRRRNRTV